MFNSSFLTAASIGSGFLTYQKQKVSYRKERINLDHALAVR